MRQNGLQPIDKKFLNVGDLFAIQFSEGAVFLEVTGWQQHRYSPYNGIGIVEGGESSGFSRLEHESDDILYIEKSDKKVLHVGIGQAPSSIRRYTNYPEGQTRLRTLPNLTVPRSGASYGYVDGEDSPFEEPTDAEELWIPPGVHLDFDFHNADTEPQEPVLNIKMREYNVRPLRRDDKEDLNAINRILTPGSPIPVVPAGSMDRQVSFDLAEYWDVEPISLEDIRDREVSR